MKTAVLTVAILAISFVLLGVKVLFVKDGKFPSGHAHDIKALRPRQALQKDRSRETEAK